MALNINGTTGISGVDASVSAPALAGTDSNTGISFPAADTIKFSTDGVERLQITNSGCSGTGLGKILQVVQTVKTDTATNSTASNTLWDYTAFNAAITTTGSNKVLVLVSVNLSVNFGTNLFIILRKGGSDVSGAVGSSVSSRTAATSGVRLTGGSEAEEASIIFRDSPSAGTHTYNLGFKHSAGSTKTVCINRSESDNDSYDYPRFISTITLMEIAA